MKRYLYIVRGTWESAQAFRVACLYLLLLALLIVVLPWLPLSYQPNELDLEQVYAKPLHWSNYQPDKAFHWLGTDGLGRDVLANVLHGARSAFMVSLPVMVLATLLGLILGALAGYYGNSKARISRAGKLNLVLTVVAVFYYGIYIPSQLLSHQAATADYLLTAALAVAFPLLLLFGLTPLLKRFPFFRVASAIDVDGLVLRLVEAQTSIPKLILILVLAALMPPTLPVLSLLLVLTFWTGPARLARAEMLRVRELPFFKAAISIGIPTAQLIARHALPHLVAPVMVSFTFGLAGLLMLESTLSFLNIGVASDLVSWGRMITGIRANTSAWWLVAIPGLFLSVTVLALQICSFYLLRTSQNRG